MVLYSCIFKILWSYTAGRRVKLKGGIESPWSHGEPYGNGFSCNYCTSRIKGGGATRLREHLGGLPGNVAACINVPLNVKAIMTDQVAVRRIRRRRNNDLRHYVEREVRESNKGLGTSSKARIPLDEEGQIQMALRESLREYDEERGIGCSSGSRPYLCVDYYFLWMNRFYRSPSVSQGPFDIDLAHSRAQAQPRVDIMLRGGSRDKLGKALAKWFHANDIPGRKADCPYFRSAIKLAQECGQGVHIPTGKELDGKFLDMNYEDMEAHMAKFKDDWKEYGVTVMCDSWTGPTMMCIINFMVYCNGRMFFHKSINATGRVQNAEFIYDCIREVVVDEIGVKNVIQIVTDNGSNYKKACRQLITLYPHITWQPCAAHTINLMLKDISRFSEVSNVVDDAKRICRFFYNHNRLHAMMREKIGGELIRWNATRFGTVFIFLQSFWDRQDKFMQWMVSDDWKNNAWKDEADHAFTYDCLLNRRWWSDMELVLNAVTPIYTVLRYADQQKNATIAGFLPKMMTAMAQIRGNLSKEKDLLDRIIRVIKKRLKYMLDDTLIVAGNPIMDWLCNSRSESTPILDEYDDNDIESPIPSRVLMDEFGMDFNTRDGKKKRKARLVDIEEEMEDDVESDSSEGSPINVELCDSSSDDGTVGDEFGDEWEFRGPSGGGACEVGPSGGGACEVGASGDGSRDGAMHEQAAPNPSLRPRSTRLKKVPVKELYKVRQTSGLCI
ncbi:hypothetical protein Zm00014a_024124 [Zea mays]|uniref:DUF659 domain-containing protein n=1 Tax=Zea mays TaxID=4577 RepID=A0A3L6DWQ5_MAIZE|nr:hypothetical protein Zm00014a_024124 [Zea mays]